MQKKLIALAIAGLSSAAFAQSNVTVYGVADMFFAQESATGHGSSSVIHSGGLAGSRLGFKGTEALGNGTSALFVLEYALDVGGNQGVGGPDLSGNKARQQMVGLTGNWGTAVAGYLQTAGYDFECATNPLAGSALDPASRLGAAGLLTCGNAGRAGNAIAYITPSFSGFTAAINHSRVGDTLGSQLAEAGIPAGTLTGFQHYLNNGSDPAATLVTFKYANGPISANYTWGKISNLNGFATQLLGGTPTLDSQTENGITGSYDFGVAKVFAAYQTIKQNDWDSTDKKWQISAAIPVGGGNVLVDYAQNKINHTAASDNSKAYTLAYGYGLSKRTTLYGGYMHVSNDTSASAGAYGITSSFSSVSGLATLLASPFTASTTLAPTAGGTSSVWAVGINHTF